MFIYFGFFNAISLVFTVLLTFLSSAHAVNEELLGDIDAHVKDNFSRRLVKRTIESVAKEEEVDCIINQTKSLINRLVQGAETDGYAKIILALAAIGDNGQREQVVRQVADFMGMNALNAEEVSEAIDLLGHVAAGGNLDTYMSAKHKSDEMFRGLMQGLLTEG